MTSHRTRRPDPGNQEWRLQANCRGMGPDLFYPDEKVNLGDDIRQVCASCPVQGPCLEYALTNQELHGFWGGKSPKERKALRSQRRDQRRREEQSTGNRLCSLCGKVKSLSEFSPDGTGGLRRDCKECHNRQTRRAWAS